MKIFTAKQIREGDAYTIREEPIAGIGLMERAAGRCAAWITDNLTIGGPVSIFCGMGNNGGDGLAITRLLHEQGYDVRAYVVLHGERFSPDCERNRLLLEHIVGSQLHSIAQEHDFPILPAGSLVVDALFGTGLNRPLEGLAANLISWLNRQDLLRIAVDMPSGMMADASSVGHTVLTATHTLSFEFFKMAFLLPENNPDTGRVHVLPIGIHPDYISDTRTPYQLTDRKMVREIYRPGNQFSHKGNFGHALLVAGSHGKMGAAVLAVRACSRSGAGLVSCHVPTCGYPVMQTAVPEAMCETDPSSTHWTVMPRDPGSYAAIGVGPGLDRHPDTAGALKMLLAAVERPMVLDADALNILSSQPELWSQVPPRTLLTPHPREFERLFGKTDNQFGRLDLQRSMSKTHQVYIILKGHYTSISTPEGRCCFNTTGNAGMATGGSGDVLTGILTGLLSRGYDPGDAAILGVYLHGLAGDLAAESLSEEALIAPDLADYLGMAFKSL